MNIQHISTGLLKAYPGNARVHPEGQVKKLAKSIKRFGFVGHVVVDGDNTIVAGHGRVEAAKLAGLATVPCIVLEGLSDEELRTFRVADNQLALDSAWDWKLLCAEVSELSGLGTGLIDEFVDVASLLGDMGVLPSLDDPPSDGPSLDKLKTKVCPNCAHEF